MDAIDLYFDNALFINLIVGALIAYLIQRYYIKEMVHKVHVFIEILEGTLEDDSVSIEEQKMLIQGIKDLLGETLVSKIKERMVR